MTDGDKGEPYPFIAPEDYKDFQGIKTLEFPKYYNEWLELYQGDERQAVLRGGTLQPITIKADEFLEHCREYGRRGNQANLLRYAMEIAGRPSGQAISDFDPFEDD